MTLLEVIQAIVTDIESQDSINAMWLEGSWATGKNNEQSDIDVWLDVADNTFDESINAFRKALADRWTIDWEISPGIYSESPKLQKHTFHLEGFPEKQRIELDLQEHSRQFMFKHDEHIIKVLFDKNATVRWDA